MKERYLKEDLPIFYKKPWSAKIEHYVVYLCAVSLVLSIVVKILTYKYRIVI